MVVSDFGNVVAVVRRKELRINVLILRRNNIGDAPVGTYVLLPEFCWVERGIEPAHRRTKESRKGQERCGAGAPFPLDWSAIDPTRTRDKA